MKPIYSLNIFRITFFYRTIIFIVALNIFGFNFKLNAQTASKYPVSFTNGVYSSISSTGLSQPDVLINDSCANITGLSPGFFVNGITYTNAIMHNNGYVELYNGTYAMSIAYYEPSVLLYYSNPVFAPFYMNLGISSAATSAAYCQTIGAEHIFEWKNFSRLNNGDDILNFQVRLNTTTGEVKFVYDTCMHGSGTVGPSVGWKSSGNSWSSDVNCLTQDPYGSPSSCNWSHAVTGYNFQSSFPTMYFNAANPIIKPNQGLTISWTPQSIVLPVRTFASVSSITGNGATISWTAPLGALQYNLQYRIAGTSCTWTDWSGNPISTNSVALTGLLQNTKYQIRVQAINGSNATIYSHSPNQGGFGSSLFNGYTPNGTFTTLQLPCSGMPNPGNTMVNNSTPCYGTQVTLSLQNSTILGTGITYQWYNNVGAIAGATSQNCIQTINSNNSFYCTVNCGSNSASSIPVSVSLDSFYNCTCVSLSNSNGREEIINVTIAGNSTNSLYASSNSCSQQAPGAGSVLKRYSNFKTLGNLVSVTQGDQVTFEIRQNECDGLPYHANGIAIWIDYNHNGLFSDPGEKIYYEPATSACTGVSPSGDKIVSGIFTIPFTAMTGQTALRIICADGISGLNLTPCQVYNYGETEDYLIQINIAPPCSGTPNPGNTLASSNTACFGSNVNFTLQNQTSGSGVAYQWYNNSGLITGATNSYYDQLMFAADQIHCAVSCNGGTIVNSIPINITLSAFINCYCSPNSQFGTSGSTYGWISNVQFGTISNASSYPSISPYYTNYLSSGSTTTSVFPGNSYPLNVDINSAYSQVGVWFDWNQNAIFDSVEFTFLGSNSSFIFPTTYTQLIDVPIGIPAGQIRMRIRTQHYSFGMNATDACTILDYGETEDYIIIVNPSIPCSSNPNPGNTIASSTMVCIGSTVNFSLQNQTSGTDVVYEWSNNAGPIFGANGPTYSQIITTTDIIYCQVKCAYGSSVVASNPVAIGIDTSNNCYCVPNSLYGTSSGVYGAIDFVEFNNISNASAYASTSPYYSIYPLSMGTTTSVDIGNSYNLNVNISSSFSQAAVWIDWDQNGIFDASEYTFLGSNPTSIFPTVFSQLINIPVGAVLGQTRMRIRSQHAALSLNATDACTLLEYGESEDYIITVNAVVPCPASPGGYFTINQSMPNFGNNFSSFGDAINALSCGISSSVVFEVVSGTGPYYEQIVIPDIIGASSINTITFIGNQEELKFQATFANEPNTLLLDGADYFRFNDLKFSGLGYPYASTCQLSNGADNNIFTNCTFSSPMDISNYGLVPFSIKTSTSGLSGSNNTLTSCTISGGYTGLTLQGGIGNKIENCHIIDMTQGIIMSEQNGAIITGNLFERPTSFTAGGIGCRIDIGCMNTIVEGNKFRNYFNTCPACLGASITGIEILAASTFGNENIIVNNLISDMYKSTGTNLGIMVFSGANYNKILHNTISFDDSLTGGDGVNPSTIGIRCGTNLVGVEVKNNVVSIGRSGLAIKYCIYIQSTNGVTCDNNGYYMHAAEGIQNYIGATIPGITIVNYTTLLDWQSANGNAWDQQSVSMNPGFANPSMYNYYPTNSLLDNIGANVGINTDITGATRNTYSPDPGCYEFTVFPIDLGVSSFVTPDSNGCYSASQPIIVKIKNHGFSPLDFNLNPATISCNVSGAITSFITSTINTGVLAPDSSLNVTLPSINMTNLGTYTFTSYTTVVGDTNTVNDSLLSPIVRTVGTIGGIITSVPSSVCNSYLPTLTLHGNYGGDIQWQSSTISDSGPWTNIGSGTSTYIPALPVTQTTYYRVEISCNGNIGISSTYTLTVNMPQVLSTTNGSRCGFGPVTLSALGSSSSTLNWYSNPSDLIPISTGNTFTTPNINTTTTYYVAATAGAPETPMNLLTSTASNNSASGVLFDINILNPIRIDSFAVKALMPNSLIKIYYRVGTGTGYNTSSVGWTYLGQATITSPTSPLSIIPLHVNLSLQPGLYSFALKSASPISFLNGTELGNIIAQDANVQIMEGYRGTSITNFAFLNPNAAWSGKLHYSTLACESSKTMVSAIVNTPPAISATVANATLCPGGSTTLNVSSIVNPNYTYTWNSIPSGFVASGNGPFIINPTTTTIYSVTAIDNTAGMYAGCGSISTVTVITGASVSAGIVSSSIDSICISGTPILTVAGALGGAIQWQSSTNSPSGPWTNVGTGLANYIPVVPLLQTTYYRVIVSCQTTNVISNVITIVVTNPIASIQSVSSGSVCGAGSISLSATTTGTSIPHWYDSPTGGLLLGTGNNFMTPTISTTTNFYVSALPGLGGITASALMPPEFSTHSAGMYTAGYWFTSPTNFTIKSLHIPTPGVLTGSTQNIAVVKFNPGVIPPPGTTSSTNAFTTLFLTQNNSNIGSIPCNVPIYTGDVIGILGQRSGVTSEAAPGYGNPIPVAIAGTLVDLYPLTMFEVLSTNPPQNLANNNVGPFVSRIARIEFDYNLGGCEEIRTSVPAIVNPAPMVNLSNSTPIICEGDSCTLSVTSPNDPHYSYIWQPGSLIGNTIQVTPTVTTIYTLYAIDNSSGTFATCQTQSTTTVTVNPSPIATIITASNDTVCEGENSLLSATVPIVPSYCSAGSNINGCGTSLPGYYINNVQFGSINNNSSCGASNNYQNFTTVSTNVTAGNIYPISVSVAQFYVYDSFWVWIDYNHDGIFSNITERTTLNSAVTATGNILIPSNALNGPTRMRIRVGFSGPTYVYDEPCGNANYGEVEDYTVNIIGGTISPYTWSPATYLSSIFGSSTVAVSLESTTTYTVTVSNSLGCIKTASKTIVVKPISSTNFSDTICNTALPFIWNGNNYSSSGTYTYTTINSMGCDSVITLNLVVIPCNTVHVTCFIQGYSDGVSAMKPVLLNQGEPSTIGACDSVDIALHNALPPYGLLYSQRTVLSQNGLATCNFPILSGSFYLVVKHRNGVQTWSANPVTMLPTTFYDFSIAASQAYGSNQVEIFPGVFAFYNGDINLDENLDLLDLSLLDADISSFNFGYMVSDLNGDGNVDLLDSPILETNISNFVFSNHP